MKKLLAILLTLSLALALAVPAFAVEDEDTAETPAAVSKERRVLIFLYVGNDV
jgi:hypothetical protein